jgi:hypothetical protein
MPHSPQLRKIPTHVVRRRDNLLRICHDVAVLDSQSGQEADDGDHEHTHTRM